MIKNFLTCYLVDKSNTKYKLPVYKDVSFVQVYADRKIEQKTLHVPTDYFSKTKTTSLNTGNFNFTLPLLDADAFRAMFSVFFGLDSYTLYIENDGIIKEHSVCVTESLMFNTQQDQVLTATISGSYSSEARVPSVPGLTTNPADLYTYIEGIGIEIDSVPLESINSFSIELANEIAWVNNNYLDNDFPVAPTNFYIKGRQITGTITQNSKISSPFYSDSSSLLVQIKSKGQILLTLDFSSIGISTRQELSDIIKKGSDFTINSNSNNYVYYKGVNIL